MDPMHPAHKQRLHHNLRNLNRRGFNQPQAQAIKRPATLLTGHRPRPLRSHAARVEPEPAGEAVAVRIWSRLTFCTYLPNLTN